MDSKVKRPLPQRDLETGKFLSKAQSESLAQERERKHQRWTEEHQSMLQPGRIALPQGYRETQLEEVDRRFLEANAPIQRLPLTDFAFLDKKVERPPEAPWYKRIGWIGPVVLAVGILVLAASQAFSAQPTPKDYLIDSCRAKMVGALVTDKMIRSNSLTALDYEKIQSQVLRNLAMQDTNSLILADSMTIVTACQMLWTSLNQDYLVIPRKTRTRFPTPSN